jgi:hypothetical protein
VASNALADTAAPINLENCNGVLIIIQEDYAVDANSMVLTVHEGATAGACTSGTYPLLASSASVKGSEFQIWVNLTAQTSDVFTKQTDAVTYTINGAAGDNAIVCFYVSASCLTNGRKWISLGAAVGDAGNLVSVTYILDGARYQGASLPEATS